MAQTRWMPTGFAVELRRWLIAGLCGSFGLRLSRRFRHGVGQQRGLLVGLQFFAEDEDVGRGLDAQADFVAGDANDRDDDGFT